MAESHNAAMPTGQVQISLHLMDGHTFQLDVDSEKWTAAVQQALRENSIVTVKDSNDETLSINPRKVIYWQAAPGVAGD